MLFRTSVVGKCKLSYSAVHLKKVVPNNLKGKNVSSQNWLIRQLNDPFVEKAKMFNYRCRSAFKLIEIDDKYGILKPGGVIIDCGAAPGSWTQVAVQRTNADEKDKDLKVGSVIAIDKQNVYHIKGATMIGNVDFTTTEAQSHIKDILGDKKVNVVLSDMAPTATGVRMLDNDNIIKLGVSVLRFAVQVSNIDASIVVKLWQCGEVKQFQTELERFYKMVKIIKPTASRSESAEIFLLGREFKGLLR